LAHSGGLRNAFRGQRVSTPDGVQWRVRRRWLTRGMRHRWAWRREAGENVASRLPWDSISDFDLAGGLLVIVGLIVVTLVLIPILLFGIELIIVGCFLAAGLVGRLLLGRPWVIEARVLGRSDQAQSLQWKVSGWRRSRQRIDDVVKELAAGRDPAPQVVTHELALPD
jgi:hypothetical protein